MALENFRISGGLSVSDTVISNADSFDAILDTFYELIKPTSGGGEGIVVVDDAKLSLTKAGADKKLYLSSDGTWSGTTVETADENTEIDDIKSVTIYIDQNGMKMMVDVSSCEADITA